MPSNLQPLYSEYLEHSITNFVTFILKFIITNDKYVILKGHNMWLDNLKELKKAKGMSAKQIAEATNLPERTIARIFSGDTNNPCVDTIRRIVAVLDGSLDDLFAECKTVVGTKELATLQEEVDRLKAENSILKSENVVLEDKVAVLNGEIDLLKLRLAHKEEIIALHNYYRSVLGGTK